MRHTELRYLDTFPDVGTWDGDGGVRGEEETEMGPLPSVAFYSRRLQVEARASHPMDVADH